MLINTIDNPNNDGRKRKSRIPESVCEAGFESSSAQGCTPLSSRPMFGSSFFWSWLGTMQDQCRPSRSEKKKERWSE